VIGMTGDEDVRAARLLAAQATAEELFDAVASRGLIAPGITERQASDAVRNEQCCLSTGS